MQKSKETRVRIQKTELIINVSFLRRRNNYTPVYDGWWSSGTLFEVLVVLPINFVRPFHFLVLLANPELVTRDIRYHSRSPSP